MAVGGKASSKRRRNKRTDNKIEEEVRRRVQRGGEHNREQSRRDTKEVERTEERIHVYSKEILITIRTTFYCIFITEMSCVPEISSSLCTLDTEVSKSEKSTTNKLYIGTFYRFTDVYLSLRSDLYTQFNVNHLLKWTLLVMGLRTQGLHIQILGAWNTSRMLTDLMASNINYTCRQSSINEFIRYTHVYTLKLSTAKKGFEHRTGKLFRCRTQTLHAQ